MKAAGNVLGASASWLRESTELNPKRLDSIVLC